MKALFLIISFTFANCRPEYDCNKPVTQLSSTSYGAPGIGRLSFSSGLNTQSSNNFGISAGVGALHGGHGIGGNVGISHSGSFGIGGHGTINSGALGTGGVGSGGLGTGVLGTDGLGAAGLETSGLGTGGLGTSGLGTGSLGVNTVGSVTNGIGNGGGIVNSGPGSGHTVVQKHIYVHVAPPEPEEEHPSLVLPAGPVQKHYKIIFIKAPTPVISPASVIAAQQRSEEKTLIYVLVKRPDAVGDVTIPTAAPTAPSKPEVYFIRYKANKHVSGPTGSSLTSSDDASSISGTAIPSSSYGPPGRSGPY